MDRIKTLIDLCATPTPDLDAIERKYNIPKNEISDFSGNINPMGFPENVKMELIEKPFSPSVLVARIRANLAQYDRLKQKGQDGLLTAGEIRLDPRSRRVFLGENEVALKNKEYELLQFFMGNPGQVFDRETLYDRVWGLEAMGDSATVAVHINRLREKLGEGVIQTVRGAGYRFEG